MPGSREFREGVAVSLGKEPTNNANYANLNTANLKTSLQQSIVIFLLLSYVVCCQILVGIGENSLRCLPVVSLT